MKWLKRIGIVVVLLLIIGVVVAGFFLSSIVTKVVNEAGPGIMGVPVTLKSAHVQLLRGKLGLRDFVLGNPEGFNTDHAISFHEADIEVDTASLKTDVIHIRRIHIDSPDVSYELGLGESNIGKILEGLSKGEKEEKKEPEGGAKKPEKKIIVDEVLIENGKVRLSAKLTQGIAAPVPLPTVHMKDIGKESGGASPFEVAKEILKALSESITQVASGAGKVLKEGAEGVGDAAKGMGHAAKDAGKAVGESATKAVEGIGDILTGKKQDESK